MNRKFAGVILAATLILFSACNNKSGKDSVNAGEVNDSVQSRTVVPEQYCNNKYKFCISYPKADFVVLEGSENEDGITFVSHDGLAKLVIYRGNLDRAITESVRLKEAYEKDIEPRGKRDVTYKTFATTSYTLMGYENKTIFYQKSIITGGNIITAAFYYEDEAKDAYYPMIDPIFKSFR